jgi:hypothetical protein
MYLTKLFALLVFLFGTLSMCHGASLYPKSLTTQRGSVSDTAVSALQTKDQSGNQDTWNKYVEFYGSRQAYTGIFSFDASSVDAASVSAFGLNVNFRGPKKSEQEWAFEWLEPASNTWIAGGDNADAADWKWSSLSLNGNGAFSSLVSNGQVQLRFSSKTSTDDCDLDFLELALTTSAPSTSGAATAAPTTRPTEQPTTAPTTAPTEAPTTKPTSAPTTRPTSAPTEAPTTRPTAAPTTKPTSAPTTRPTSAPTTKPTTAPTAAPTTAPTSKPTTKPTTAPTTAPTTRPTTAPTTKPTSAPTTAPTTKPTTAPTTAPSAGGRVCPAGSHYQPGPGTTWQWQLSGTIDQSFNVQVYDIDMFDSSTTLITQLHNAGRAVICYIDTAYEPGRPDSSQFTAAVLGSGIDGWPGQKWVDIRSTVVRNIMSNRIAQAAAKGCDAVEMDDVDSYTNNPGFPLTAADQISFNSFLATTAHANGLGIGLKNDLDQVSALASQFDFAINEQCFQYSECDSLSTFINQGKAVFGVEYDLATSQFCTQANADKFSWLKKDLDLDAQMTQCCTTCSGTHTCVASTSARSVQEEQEQALIDEVLASPEEVAEVETVEMNSSGAKVSAFASVVVIATLFVALF